MPLSRCSFPKFVPTSPGSKTIALASSQNTLATLGTSWLRPCMSPNVPEAELSVRAHDAPVSLKQLIFPVSPSAFRHQVRHFCNNPVKSISRGQPADILAFALLSSRQTRDGRSQRCSCRLANREHLISLPTIRATGPSTAILRIRS